MTKLFPRYLSCMSFPAWFGPPHVYLVGLLATVAYYCRPASRRSFQQGADVAAEARDGQKRSLSVVPFAIGMGLVWPLLIAWEVLSLALGPAAMARTQLRLLARIVPADFAEHFAERVPIAIEDRDLRLILDRMGIRWWELTDAEIAVAAAHLSRGEAPPSCMMALRRPLSRYEAAEVVRRAAALAPGVFDEGVRAATVSYLRGDPTVPVGARTFAVGAPAFVKLSCAGCGSDKVRSKLVCEGCGSEDQVHVDGNS